MLIVQATVAGRVAHSVLADANLVLDAASAAPDQWQCGRGRPGQSLQGRFGRGPWAHGFGWQQCDGYRRRSMSRRWRTTRLRGAVASALLDVRAVATASVSGQRFSFGGILNLGSITGRASAHNGGGGPAKGLVDIAIENLGLGQVTGPINVSANAHNLGGLPKGSSGIAASANADLALTGGAGGLSAADVTVVAHGTNSGSGGVAAHSRLALAGFSGVGLGNAQVDAVALNERSHANGAAVADASFSAGVLAEHST